MALKPFNQLKNIDLSGKIAKKPIMKKLPGGGYEKKGELDYLPWANCLTALYENGAERVLVGNVHNKDDHPLFLLNGDNPFVRVFVEIDGDRRELDYPVIDGSRVIKAEFITQSDIHNASQRGFVKCVAMNWGLGLECWIKEEKEIESTRTPDDDIGFHSPLKVRERVEQLFTVKLQNGSCAEQLYAAIDKDGDAKNGEKTFNKTMQYLQHVVVIEQRLREA